MTMRDPSEVIAARQVNEAFAVIARRFVGDDLLPLDSARVPYPEILSLHDALNALFSEVDTTGLSPKTLALLAKSKGTSDKIAAILATPQPASADAPAFSESELRQFSTWATERAEAHAALQYPPGAERERKASELTLRYYSQYTTPPPPASADPIRQILDSHAQGLREHAEALYAEPPTVVNVADFGADPTGQKDSTPAFKMALEYQAAIANARRYEWLRSDDVEEPEYSVFRCSGAYPTGEAALVESTLDAEIDAAMTTTGPEG
jgi:hypothetical protein